MARAKRTSRVHSSNVLYDGDGASRLWSFASSDCRPAGVTDLPTERPLPAKLVGKGWGQLLRPRANVAWVGDQSVLLQVIALPTDDPAEVSGMVELQLEKLSPLPVAQVVWTYAILPGRSSAGMPVLVMIAERSEVESLLGSLEQRGYIPDRLESPLLSLVAGARFEQDGAQVIAVQIGGRSVCLVGWVFEGALRALNVVHLSEDDRRVPQLVAELNRLAWAGELEGWASGEDAVHVLGDEALVGGWREPLAAALGRPVTVSLRPPDADLARASALRAAREPESANLLPPEHLARYRQQFTDKLWMGGLGALFMAYLAGVLVYMGAVQVQRVRQERLADDLAQVNTAYTNTLRLKAQTQVLQETVNLRYAALDSWMAVVEAMPEELTLENLAFSGGQSLVISGLAPADQESKVSTDFWQALRRARVGNTNLFSEVQLRPTAQRTVQGVPQIQWSFTCRLQRQEI